MNIKILFNRVILKIFNVLKVLILGNFIAKAPQNTIKSIIASYRLVQESVLTIIKIRDSKIETYDYPENFPVYFSREKTFSERYLYVLKDIFISLHTGVVWTRNQILIQESFGSFKNMFVKSDIRPYLNLSYKKINYDDDYLYFLPCVGFYHFLLEEIPALLHAYEKFSDLKILVPKLNLPKYYLEILNTIFGKELNEKIISVTKNLLVSKLLLVQKEDISGFVCSEDIELLNKYINNDKEVSNYKRLYISRQYASKRKLPNEIELEKKLKSIGFRIIYLEQISFFKQFKLIKGAELIIAPHGAGLSHLVWGKRKKTLIEIFPSYENHGYSHTNDCYARLASQKGIKYSYIECVNQCGEAYIPIDKVLNELNKYE